MKSNGINNGKIKVFIIDNKIILENKINNKIKNLEFSKKKFNFKLSETKFNFILKYYDFSEFIGIYFFENEFFFTFVNKCKLYTIINNNKLYIIVTITLVNINSFTINNYLSDLFTNYYQNNYYFYENYDKNNIISNYKNNINNEWIFYYNLNLLRPIINNEKLIDWINPVFNLYIFKIPFVIDDKQKPIEIIIRIYFNIFFYDNNEDNLEYFNVFGFKNNLNLVEISTILDEKYYSIHLCVNTIPKILRNYYKNKKNINQLNMEKDYIYNSDILYSFKKFLNFKWKIKNIYYLENEKYETNLINKNCNNNLINVINDNYLIKYFLNIFLEENNLAIIIPSLDLFYNNYLPKFLSCFLNTYYKKIKNQEVFLDEIEIEKFSEIIKFKINNNINLIIKKFENNKNKINTKLYKYINFLNIENNIYKYIQSNNIHIWENKKIKLLCITFNLSGFEINKFNDIKEFILNLNLDNIDLIFFGIQEIFELKSHNLSKIIYSNNQNIITPFLNYLNTIFEKMKFNLFLNSNMVGILSMIYTKRDSYFSLKVLDITEKKMGFFNSLGNKGFISIRLMISNEYISFTNCHFDSGTSLENINKRGNQLLILENFLQNQSNNLDIILGDFNLRTTNNFEDNKVWLQEYFTNNDILEQAKIIKKLLTFDELIIHMIKFKENIINFLPTYKYLNNEISNKKISQSASYCDRIMYRDKPNINLKNLSYTSKQNVIISDHKYFN